MSFENGSGPENVTYKCPEFGCEGSRGSREAVAMKNEKVSGAAMLKKAAVEREKYEKWRRRSTREV